MSADYENSNKASLTRISNLIERQSHQIMPELRTEPGGEFLLEGSDVSRTVSPVARLPDEVRRASEERRLILFLGAGLSCAAGLSSWEKVKNELISKFRLGPEDDENLRVELQRMDPYDCFELIRGKDRTVYERVVETSLKSDSANMPRFIQLLNNLSSLKPVSFVTTNFDDLLHECGKFKPDQFRYTAECAPQELRENKVFCLHGNREKNVFSRHDRNALYTDSDFRCFLHNLFGSYSVLFLGYSFRDRFLLECAALNRNLSRYDHDHSRHFALLPSNHDAPGNNELRTFYGIQVFRYVNEDNTHQNFIDSIFSWTKVKGQTL